VRRKIIRIDEEKCTGCGLCVPDCPEGALRIIDGKARLVGDLFCDGLGACLKNCPEGAIAVEEREAEPYDERKVMANIIPQGRNVIMAHLDHLREHRQMPYLQQALAYVKERRIDLDFGKGRVNQEHHAQGQCPGSRTISFSAGEKTEEEEAGTRSSRLTHWPIQLHLISPFAPHYQESDLLLVADCVAYSMADFHKDCLDGRTLAIACPKLDHGQETYMAKLIAFMDEARVRSIRVMIMQVPCCSGLLRLAMQAAEQAKRKVPITCTVVGINGAVLEQPSGLGVRDHGLGVRDQGSGAGG